MKLNAKQIRQAALIAKQYKQDHKALSMYEFTSMVDEFLGVDDELFAIHANAAEVLYNWRVAAALELNRLQEEIAPIEAKTGLFLFDENCAEANLGAGINQGSMGYYPEMLRHMYGIIAQRLDEIGLDINEELGRVVF